MEGFIGPNPFVLQPRGQNRRRFFLGQIVSAPCPLPLASCLKRSFYANTSLCRHLPRPHYILDVQWKSKSASHLKLNDFLLARTLGYTSPIMGSYISSPRLRLLSVPIISLAPLKNITNGRNQIYPGHDRV